MSSPGVIKESRRSCGSGERGRAKRFDPDGSWAKERRPFASGGEVEKREIAL